MRNPIRFTLVAALSLALGTALSAQPVSFSTLAGNAGYGWVDAAGAEARFNFPEGVAADGFGTVYVADTQNSAIRRIDSSGVVTTLAGAAGQTGSADGTGAEARFDYPQGLALGSDGNLYVADTGNSTIRRVSLSGTVTTLAGAPGVIGSADGTNAAALFNLPAGIAADTAGWLYIADTGNSTIRVLSPSGTNWVAATVAGSPTVAGHVDGTNRNALFYQPWGVAVDTNRNMYVADTGNSALRRIAPTGTNWVTSTLAKLGLLGGVTLDGAGNLFVADSGDNVIRKVAWSGTNWAVVVLAGSIGVAGSADGPQGTNAALFNYPRGITASHNGMLYVADSLNHSIRQVTTAGVVTTLAGEAGGPGYADGVADQARFNAPLGLAVDAQQNVYVADSQNNAIRRVSPSGLVSTVARSPAGLPGSADGAGTNASFNAPAAVAVDAQANLYVADSLNNNIRKLVLNGTDWLLSTLAGRAGQIYFGEATNVISNGAEGVTNIIPISYFPNSLYANYSGVITNIVGVVTNLPLYTTNRTMATNSAGQVVITTNVISNLGGVVASFTLGATNLYCVVTNTPLFHTNSPSGPTNFVALLATNSFTLNAAPPLLNGVGTNALFNSPSGLALDPAGNLYVADGGTNGVRVVAPGGAVSTLAGSVGAYAVSSAEFGTKQLFYQSSAVAVDGAGTVYVADAENNVIRQITPSGAVLTIAGAPGWYGTADGTNGDARFGSPAGIAVDAQGNLYVADTLSDTVRKVAPAGSDWVVSTVGGSPNAPGSADGVGIAARFNHPRGIAVDGSGNLYIADTENHTLRLGRATSVAPMGLNCTRVTSQVILTWPATSAHLVLEAAGNPAGSRGWTPVANVSAAFPGQWVVTNVITAPAAFYRLRPGGM